MRKIDYSTNRINKFYFRVPKKSFDKLHTLADEVLRTKNLSSHHKSTILEDALIMGLQELLSKHVSMEDYTHTNLNNISEKQKRENFINDLLESALHTPLSCESIINMFFFNQELFGTDIHHRTALSWFNKFLLNKKIQILNLRRFGFKDILIVNIKSKWFNQLDKYCMRYNNIISSISKKKDLMKQIRGHLSLLFDTKDSCYYQAPDIAENQCILWLKYEMKILSEKPMNNNPIVSEIIECRSKGKFSEALELIDQEYEHRMKPLNEMVSNIRIGGGAQR